MASIQQQRPLALTTPLGEDVLLIQRMSGSERLGRMYEYRLGLLCADENLKVSDLLGKGVTIRLALADGERFFHGIVSRFAQVGRSGGYASFEATVRPSLWFLTRTSNCRIFQGKAAPDIIKQVLDDRGVADYEFSLSRTYPKLEYCVQYRETDFDFVSRLMEHEGIYYYFKHSDGKHVVVFADGYDAHEALAGGADIPYRAPSENIVRVEDHFFDWCLEQEIQPGRCALGDYCFETPNVSLLADASISREHAMASLEVFDYPGTHQVEDVGKHYATTRIEELQACFERVRASGNVRRIMAGGLFKLVDCPRQDQNREYLVISVDHQLENPEYASAGGGGELIYSCDIEALDAKQPFRPARVTPKPHIRGPQTAVVSGKSGEEIWTDKYGRVKVQFHWDREGKNDENTSCWVRVATPWAGKNWGGIHIPRIGQEVVIEFLEGDPDRPIITGSVYNAAQMPPYGLPANQTQSGLKSRSSKGGGTEDFNEFRFEDKKGDEQIYFHAQKNYDQIVENDRTEDVGHDRSLHVAHDKDETVDNNKSITVGVNHDETIGANKTLTVGANHDESIGSNMSIIISQMLTETVGINYAETVGAAMELTVGAAMTETIGAGKAQSIGNDKTITIGGDKSESVGKSKTVEVDKDLTEKIGGVHKEEVTKEYMLTAKKVQVTAQDEITITTGSASITMKKDGTISIKGKNVTVEGSGKINVKASSDLVLKGSKIAAN